MRLQAGTENSTDMDDMAAWMRSCTSAPVPESPLPAVKNLGAGQGARSYDKSSNKTTPVKTKLPVIPSSPDIGLDRESVLHKAQLATLRESYHAYGSKAALCVETAVIEDLLDARTPVFHSLNIEMAPAKAGGHYDWTSKVIFRLTKREFPLFIAVLMGWSPSLSFSNHGTENDKSLEITDQGPHFFFKLRQGKVTLAMPLLAEELFGVVTLAITTLARNTPTIDTQSLMAIIKRTAAMHNTKAK